MNTHLEILVKELIKNGVSAKCCEIITDNEGNVSASEPFLDFSEHDKKVAEENDERITELERENNSLKEKLSFIRTRVTEEARDFWDKDMFGSLVVTVPKKFSDDERVIGMEKEIIEKNNSIIEKNQRIIELLNEIEEIKKDWCFARMSELEDRHQSDCIEINRLNVALEVMTEKYMKLREVHGL